MRAILPFVFAVALAVGCSSNTTQPAPEPSQGSAVLAPGARVLDAQGLAALQSVTPDGHFQFASGSPVLDSLAVGNVLLVDVTNATPRGAMVQVLGVTRQGGGYVVATQPATLAQAFEELHVSLKKTITPAAMPGTVMPQADSSNGGVNFPVGFSGGDEKGHLDVTGSMSVAPQMGLSLNIDWTRFELTDLSLHFGASETLAASVSAQGSAHLEQTVPLGTIPFAPIVLTIPTPAGVVPLVLTPNVVVEAGIEGGVDGDATTSASQQASFDLSVGYQDGHFGGTPKSDSKFDFEPPTFAAAANLEAFAGPRLEVLIYGAVGPFADAKAYLQLGAYVDPMGPCVRGALSAGLRADVGVKVIGDYEAKLLDASYPLAKYDSCDPASPRPASSWARSFGREGSTGEHAKAVAELSDGTFVIVGQSELFGGVTGGDASMWALRLDALGNPLWQRAFSGAEGGAGEVRGVTDAGDGVLVAASTSVTKLDYGGNVVWAQRYDADSGYLDIGSIASPTDDHGFVVAGTAGIPPQAWAMKLDANGGVVWSREWQGDRFNRVRRTSDGGHVLVGNISTGDGDMLLVKLDASGQATWARALDDRYQPTEDTMSEPLSGIDYGYDVVEKPGGGFFVVGQTYGAFPLPETDQPGFFAGWIAEVDGGGALVDSTLFRAPATAIDGSAYAVAVRSDGTTIVAGQEEADPSDALQREDVLLVRGSTFTALGGSKYDRIEASTATGAGEPLRVTSDGGAILVATSNSFAQNDQFWVVKLNRAGDVVMEDRAPVAGNTITTGDSVSIDVLAPTTDASVTATSFADQITSEVTPIVTVRQTP